MPKKHPRLENIEYVRGTTPLSTTVGYWSALLLDTLEKRDRLKEELAHIERLLKSDMRAATCVVEVLAPPAALSTLTPEEHMRRVYLEKLPEFVERAEQGHPACLRMLLRAFELQ